MPIDFSCPHCGKRTKVADSYAGTSGNCGACGQSITIPGLAKPGGSTSSTNTVAIVLAVCLLGMCAFGGILVALLLPAVNAARETVRRVECTNNLKQIALAMHNYHDTYNCFPAAYIEDENGRPMHSWRVALLPFLGATDVYERYNFNEPWDSPDNLLLVDKMPECFRCPSSPFSGTPETNYVVVMGDQTMFGPNRWRKMAHVTDGLSNTIMIVETTTPVNWMEPGNDLQFETLSRQINGGPQSISSHHINCANVAMGDGATRSLPNNLPPETLSSLLTIADGRTVVY
jgi:hypothetical protein